MADFRGFIFTDHLSTKLFETYEVPYTWAIKATMGPQVMKPLQFVAVISVFTIIEASLNTINNVNYWSGYEPDDCYKYIRPDISVGQLL